MKAVTTSARKKASILVADDHPVVRYGVTRILGMEPDMEICGEAENQEQVLAAIKKRRPDLIILDISMKDTDGLKLTRLVTRQYKIPVLILSMHDETLFASKALIAGARGYIMKEESSDRLVQAVRTVLGGGTCVSDNVKASIISSLGKTVEQHSKQNAVYSLSKRERQVFVLIGKGYPCKLIAEKLCLSVKTVETHRSRIKAKLDIEDSSQLVIFAARWSEREENLIGF